MRTRLRLRLTFHEVHLPRICSVCTSQYVADVNRALADGEPYRSVGERFGLGASSVFRHKTQHLSGVGQPQLALLGADVKRLEQRLKTAEGRIGFLAKMFLKLLGSHNESSPS